MDINKLKFLAGLIEESKFTTDVSPFSQLREKYAIKAVQAAYNMAEEFVKEARATGIKPSDIDVNNAFLIPDESDVITRMIEILHDDGF